MKTVVRFVDNCFCPTGRYLEFDDDWLEGNCLGQGDRIKLLGGPNLPQVEYHVREIERNVRINAIDQEPFFAHRVTLRPVMVQN